MKGRTFTFKTGKPVDTKPLGFLTTKEAERQHAEFFAEQERLAARQQETEINALEQLMGLFAGGR